MGDFVLHLGARDITVRLVDIIQAAGEEPDTGSDGSHRRDDIQISRRTAASEREETAIHEALHAIFELAGLKMVAYKEEEIVKRLSPWVHTLIKQNPDFLALVGSLDG
jgi:hypothetical protein